MKPLCLPHVESGDQSTSRWIWSEQTEQSLLTMLRGRKVGYLILTLLLCRNFHARMGRTKMGIPIYAAIKSDDDQRPLRNTGNPVIIIMIIEPMRPTHAAYGCKGAFQGSVSRLIPCILRARRKRMLQRQSVAQAIRPATVLIFNNQVKACAAPPSPRPVYPAQD